MDPDFIGPDSGTYVSKKRRRIRQQNTAPVRNNPHPAQEYIDLLSTRPGEAAVHISGAMNVPIKKLINSDRVLKHIHLGDPAHIDIQTRQLVLRKMTRWCRKNISEATHDDCQRAILAPNPKHRNFSTVRNEIQFLQYIALMELVIFIKV